MDLTPDIPAGRQVIEAYGDGGFRVSGARTTGSVIVTPNQTLGWSVKDVAELTPYSFTVLDNALDPIEVLLLGCGDSIAFVKPDIRAALKDRGIALDLMDTGAACRTYNVLMAEDRRVAAALIAI